MSRSSKRMVVCLPSDEQELRRLPSSHMVNQRWIYGGVRGMHELAFAAAAAGLDVELRGWIDQQAFDELKEATVAAPRLEAGPIRVEGDGAARSHGVVIQCRLDTPLAAHGFLRRG
jgi:hypothetical protein